MVVSPCETCAGSPPAGYAWIDAGCVGGQTSVHVALTGGSGSFATLVTVFEFQNVATSSPVDQVKAASSNSSGSFSITTSATTQASEVVVGLATAAEEFSSYGESDQ